MTQKIITPALTAIALVFSVPGIATASPNHCPPGLAKKTPACVPPGQARHMTESDWHDHWSIGDHIENHSYDYYDNADILRLYGQQLPPLPADQAYVVLDGGLVAIDRDTLEIVSLVTFLANL